LSLRAWLPLFGSLRTGCWELYRSDLAASGFTGPLIIYSMRLHRFYSGPEGVAGSVLVLPPDESRHLSQVLRLKPGDEVLLFDGRGNEYRCKVLDTGKEGAKVEVLEPIDHSLESPLNLTLGQALAKGDKFDLIVQKATELSVTAIVPLTTERADVRLSNEQAERRVERWRRISLESLKQCGRSKLVEIASPASLGEFLGQLRPGTSAPGDAVTLVCNERGGISIRDALAEAANPPSVTVLIGPEGGWDDGELELVEREGCRFVTLGPRILRMETAAIVALALIQERVGDLSCRPDPAPAHHGQESVVSGLPTPRVETALPPRNDVKV
jgi:16S rRNA (uracil1498-N3)-methyltransferase